MPRKELDAIRARLAKGYSGATSLRLSAAKDDVAALLKEMEQYDDAFSGMIAGFAAAYGGNKHVPGLLQDLARVVEASVAKAVTAALVDPRCPDCEHLLLEHADEPTGGTSVCLRTMTIQGRVGSWGERCPCRTRPPKEEQTEALPIHLLDREEGMPTCGVSDREGGTPHAADATCLACFRRVVAVRGRA